MVDEKQRSLTRVLLGLLSEQDVALAGSGAIREHGLIDRPTEDIDLFTTSDILDEPERFEHIAQLIVDGAEIGGYEIVNIKGTDFFRHFSVLYEDSVYKVDLAADYRHDKTTKLNIGNALSLADSVANKVDAVFSRGEVRDFLDLDSIRENGPYSDAELIDLAKRNDLGFETDLFSRALMKTSSLTAAQVERYGITETQLDAVKRRLEKWASELVSSDSHSSDTPKQEMLHCRSQAKHCKTRNHGRNNYRGFVR